MSNRILWILIIIGFIGAIVLFYLYFFVYYTSTLTVTSNISPFSFSLASTKLPQRIEYTCEKSPCTYTDISPFVYEIQGFATWYTSEIQNFSLPSSSSYTVDIQFEKKIELMEVPEVNSWSWEVSTSEKVSIVKLKKSSYTFFDIPTLGYFSFEAKKESMDLFYQADINSPKKLIGNFDLVNATDIRLIPFLWSKTKILLSLEPKTNYSIDIDTKEIISFNLDPEAQSVKQGESDSEYIVSTKLGAYIYDTRKDIPEYFSQFHDFVYSPDKKLILGYVSSHDETRLANLWFEWEFKNSIVSFDRESLERKIVLSLDNELKHIYASGSQIFVEDIEGKVFEIKGL